jgi:hypothetical protein
MRTAYLLIRFQSPTQVADEPKITTSYNIYNSPMDLPHYVDPDLHWSEPAPLQDPYTTKSFVLAAGTQDANANVKILAVGWVLAVLKELKPRVLEETRKIMEVSSVKLC